MNFMVGYGLWGGMSLSLDEELLAIGLLAAEDGVPVRRKALLYLARPVRHGMLLLSSYGASICNCDIEILAWICTFDGNVTVSRPRLELLGFFESYQATSDTPLAKIDALPCYGSVD